MSGAISRTMSCQIYVSIFISCFVTGRSQMPEFYKGEIRNQSIEDCMALRRWNLKTAYSNEIMSTTELIKMMGYPAEEHTVMTEDGYYLTMHRIPGKPGSTPVLVQHGILCSSFEWVVNGRKKALAFVLADEGYDVWLGNARGNTYSACHEKYSQSDYEYWNFSWHEMGVYDLPAVIPYITNKTGKEMIYIGYSMGATMFYVMAIERPDIATQVKAMFAVSPLSFTSNARSPLKILTPFTKNLQQIFHTLRLGNLFSHTPRLDSDLRNLCNPSLQQRKNCMDFLFFLAGSDPEQFDYALLPLILTHFPAGVAMKSLFHYFQGVNSRKFTRYDYGEEMNLRLYKSIEPTSYNISQIQVPIGIFWAENDYVSDQRDVQRFYDQVPRKILNYKIQNPKFNHIDIMWAKDAYKFIYSKILSVMERYR